jgi:type IV pilus assembly protein PilO
MALDLNEKPWYVAASIGLVLGIAILFVANQYLFKEIREDKARIIDRIDELDREIEKGRTAKANLPKLEEDIRNYELELDRLKRILPTKRETDNIIKRLKQQMERGGFKLVSFRPQAPQDRDFYQEWPINVTLDGTYHELGMFFDHLSRFPRIINVSELDISPLKAKQSDMTIHASFTQTTFIYKE